MKAHENFAVCVPIFRLVFVAHIYMARTPATLARRQGATQNLRLEKHEFDTRLTLTLTFKFRVPRLVDPPWWRRHLAGGSY